MSPITHTGLIVSVIVNITPWFQCQSDSPSDTCALTSFLRFTVYPLMKNYKYYKLANQSVTSVLFLFWFIWQHIFNCSGYMVLNESSW